MASLSELFEGLGDHDEEFWLRQCINGVPEACVQLPENMVRLMLAHRWETFAFTGSDHFRPNCGLMDWRRHAGAVAILPAPAAPEPASEMTAQPFDMVLALDEVLEHVRTWRSMWKTGAATASTAAGEEEVFEQVVSSLTLVQDGLSFKHMRRDGSNSNSYSMIYLIRIVLLCAHVRNAMNVRDVLARALAVVFQHSIATALQQRLDDDDVHVPSATTISHARFTFDMSLMLLQRAYFNAIMNGAGCIFVGHD